MQIHHLKVIKIIMHQDVRTQRSIEQVQFCYLSINTKSIYQFMSEREGERERDRQRVQKQYIKSIFSSSIIYQSCIHHASIMHSSCIHHASIMYPSCIHCTLYFHSLHSFSSTFHSILAFIVLCTLYPLYFVPCTLYFIPCIASIIAI